ncbi:MAG: oligosaccharide flippase family protein [Candidatus Roizmanbacteria bacterium]|nr:oligosaccharide flippase family protein [Candidatus Roizmanbacteria bacterium]
MKPILLKLSKNSFIQGGFFLTASSFIAGFLNYLFNIFAGRALGPEGYGEIAALFAYMAVLSIPMGTITSLLIQKIGSAENPKEYAIAAHSWILEKSKKWWYLGLVVVVITPFIPTLTNLTPLSGYILPILMILSFAGSYYTGALQGLHLFFWFAIISIGSVALKLVGSLLALYGFGGLEVVLIFLIVSGMAGLLMSHIVFVRQIQKKGDTTIIKSNRIRNIFRDKQLWLTTSVTGALALINNVDIMFVKKTFDAEQAGIYSSWALFAKIIFYVLGPILTMAFIFFSSKKHELRHQIVFIGSFIFLAVVGLVANLGYGLYGKFIVDSFFGGKFWGVIPYLEWAAYFGTGYTMMTFMTMYYLAKKSKLALLPALLFPLYIIALFVYSQTIAEVMYISTIYTFLTITIFLLIFFKDRFLYLIR